MTDSRWPILGLDGDATEAQIRRAYAARLRAQGPDAAVAQFAALRAEFEAALKHVRSLRPRASEIPRRSGSEPVAKPAATDLLVPIEGFDSGEPAARAIGEIRVLLGAGDLVAACRRYDAACGAGEIGLGDETEIETDLAQGWLADHELDAAVLAEIARRYRWDNIGTAFAFAPQIVARLRPALPTAKPGSRFIGEWNWGAFCLTPFWLFAHGQAARGVAVFMAYALFFAFSALSPVGMAGILWIAFWHGQRANAMAAASRVFRDDAQFIVVQNAWRNWGIGIWIGACACLVALIASIGGQK